MNNRVVIPLEQRFLPLGSARRLAGFGHATPDFPQRLLLVVDHTCKVTLASKELFKKFIKTVSQEIGAIRNTYPNTHGIDSDTIDLEIATFFAELKRIYQFLEVTPIGPEAAASLTRYWHCQISLAARYIIEALLRYNQTNTNLWVIKFQINHPQRGLVINYISLCEQSKLLYCNPNPYYPLCKDPDIDSDPE
jgi:hypothetical protein